MAERYNILYKGEYLYSNLSQEEYFDTMQNLAIEYYQNSMPDPADLKTEIMKGDD